MSGYHRAVADVQANYNGAMAIAELHLELAKDKAHTAFDEAIAQAEATYRQEVVDARKTYREAYRMAQALNHPEVKV